MTATTALPTARRNPGRTRRTASGLPWLVPAFAIGIAGTVLAYQEARHSTSHTHFAVFWVAQLVVLCTVFHVGGAQARTRRTRLGILAAYALFNFLPKLLISPSHAVFFDEFGHWRQVQDILRTGQLTPHNAYQPIIRNFPGLELLTAGVHEVTRLSAWHSGQLVIGAAHVATLLLVFGIARGLGLSERLSFLSAVVYSLNPSFQYFDTEFSYESLGIPLALVAIWCALRARGATSATTARNWTGLGCVAAAGCAVTHHLSSGFMVIGVGLVAIFVRRTSGDEALDRSRNRAGWVLLVWTIAAVVVWIGVFARPTLSYIAPHVDPAFSQLAVRLGLESAPKSAGVTAPSTSRTLFSNSLSPAYERYCGYASPFVAMLGVVATLFALWRRRRRDLALRLSPAIILACGYLASLPFTLTAAGAEGAHRSWAYTYLGVGVIVAYGLDRLETLRPARRRPGLLLRRAVTMLALVVLAIGGVTLGVDVYYRFPGPYVFGTDSRSLTNETIAMATWATRHLPSGSHVVTDRFTGEAIEGFTDLQVPSPAETEAYQIYREGGYPTQRLRRFLAAHRFSYFILDTRALTHAPVQSLFRGYAGPVSVQRELPRSLTRTGFGTLIHRTRHYRIYALHP